MIDKTELQNAMEQYQLKAMAEIFDDDFVDKILNFDKKDPISEMYIDGIYNYYKNRYLSTGINKTHNKVLQLNICINELLTKYRLKDWLLSKKKEYLKSEKDNANKNAILGEIFTAGYFARIFVDSLTPIKTSRTQTPDFEIELNKHKIIVEVNTPSMNTKEVEKLEKFHKEVEENFKKNKKSGISINTCCVCAAGYNPKYRTTAENWISKLSNIKSTSEQFSPDDMNLLVVNLFNPYMDVIDCCHFEPIFMSHLGENYYSGNIWQAFYGKENDNILEDYDGCLPPRKMCFDGMFYRKNNCNISAAVIMLPYKTVIFENPNATTPLNYDVLMGLTRLHNFDLNLSRVRIPNSYYLKNTLENTIEQDRQKINSINREDCICFH